VCTPNKHGEPIPVGKAEDHIFGLVLMNDWSARDIQTWEYVPLGPFNAKNFGTTISPWVVLMDALEPFRAETLKNETELQAYLKDPQPKATFDIKLDVDLTTTDGTTTTISKSNATNLLWSFPQMLAHHTVGGCPMNTGDLLGSGTISGKERDTLGSMLEINRAGKDSVKLANGEERKFLLDGDTVTLRGVCGTDGNLVGFGECVGQILPAPPLAQ
jgi:fumarylacetoacetase